ncbi:beta-ketoacyl synthase N-terminal-like domain-containing protein [Archangium sp.]|uniref:beta-ketoacyl synthase N-terminal-like domain-containing protein n=1 Tax=Archangium sp. TaxID=1872627 RepID=UPI0039C8A2CC
MRLSTHALADLLWYSGLQQAEQGFWRNTALYMGLSPTRDESIDFYDDLLEEQLVEEAARHVGLPIAAKDRVTFFQGHASALVALHQAASAIQQGHLERAIICGVDSLVGPDELQVLYEQERLKTPARSRGLMAGEASAAFLVEPLSLALRRQAPLQCLVGAIEVGQEPRPRAEGGLPMGLELSKVIDRSLRSSSRVGTLYGDLNGEDSRASEWGGARVRLQSRHDLSGAVELWPATSLGDTGAASGALSVVAAARSLSRGHTAPGEVLVWSSADSGEVASALLRRHEPSRMSSSLPKH